MNGSLLTRPLRSGDASHLVVAGAGRHHRSGGNKGTFKGHSECPFIVPLLSLNCAFAVSHLDSAGIANPTL